MEPDRSAAHVRRRARGVAAGLVATAVALGVAELVRSADRDMSSPVVDVGARFIDATPRWLKDLAIEWFGTNDKIALVVGIVAIMGAYAAVVGIAATRRRRVGPAGVALFSVVGALASGAGGGGPLAALPSVVGGVAGGATIWFLTAPPGAGAPAAPSAPRWAPTSRRAFLAASGGLLAVAAAAATTGRWLGSRFDVAAERARILLPRALRPLPEVPPTAVLDEVPGITPFMTPNSDFYRIDTALVAPRLAVEGWELTVWGMVSRSLRFGYEDLLARDLVESDITLSCVSNEVGGRLAGNARWLGVPLAELLEEAGVDAAADQVVGRSTDGFTAGFPLRYGAEAERGALVAVGMNGEPLPVEHGFPARLVVPGLYGSVSATKWLTAIELTTFDRFDAYWVERDWSPEGIIKTFSRIDTPGPLERIEPGVHPIAGVAWAQTRGIDGVEVRVDGGRWVPARLADELDDRTWRQWVIEHEFSAPGRHTIECRATDGTGAIQTEERSEPFPDGASGWHSVAVLVG